jgi:hypothetical protein
VKACPIKKVVPVITAVKPYDAPIRLANGGAAMLVREILCVGLLLAFAAAAGDATGLHLAQGALAGEVTATTVVLQTRLTATPGLQNGDVPGGNGAKTRGTRLG